MRARKSRPLAPAELTDVQIAAAIALGAVPALTKATEPEVLDEEFLEYLAEFEDAKDDWSWFDQDDKATAAKKNAVTPPRRAAPESKAEKP